MQSVSSVALAGLLIVCAAGSGGAAEDARERLPGRVQGRDIQLAQAARTCRAVSTCREAVLLWCGGYRRADADHDGLPYENVCRSLAQVEAIKGDIGC